MGSLKTWLASAALCAAAASTWAAGAQNFLSTLDRSAQPAPEPSVAVRLVAQNKGLTPQAENLLAVVLEHAPGWHTYWRMPATPDSRRSSASRRPRTSASPTRAFRFRSVTTTRASSASPTAAPPSSRSKPRFLAFPKDGLRASASASPTSPARTSASPARARPKSRSPTKSRPSRLPKPTSSRTPS